MISLRYPTQHFTIWGSQNTSIDISEIYKICRIDGFRGYEIVKWLICFQTKTFTILELQNPSNDVSELYKIR